jgi:hypothetical protein
MSTALVTGVIGLLGVIVGGVLNSWATLRLQERTRRAEARAGIREIQLEFSQLTFSLLNAKSEREWGELPEPPWDEAWRLHRTELSRALTFDEDWYAIAKAYALMRPIERLRQKHTTGVIEPDHLELISRQASYLHTLRPLVDYALRTQQPRLTRTERKQKRVRLELERHVLDRQAAEHQVQAGENG